MIRLIARLCRNDVGATAVEYGLILALIVLAMLGALQTFGGSVMGMWNYVDTTINAAIDN